MPAKPLTLVVDATVTPLETSMKDAKRYITDLSLTAGQMVDKINADLAKIGKGGGERDNLKQLVASQKEYLKLVEAGARVQQRGFDKGTAEGATQAAAALRALAAEQTRISEAARTATGATEAETIAIKAAGASAARAAHGFGEQATAMELNASVLTKLGVTSNAAANTVVGGHERMGVSSQILLHSVRATGDSFAAGLPPMMIFGEQIGRVAEAASYAGPDGALGKFGAFMGGPWGIGIVAGVSVLSALIGHLDLFTDKLTEAEKKLHEEADAQDVASRAAAAFAVTADGVIAKENELVKALQDEILHQDKLAQARKQNAGDSDSAQNASSNAAGNLARLEKQMADLKAGMGRDVGLGAVGAALVPTDMVEIALKQREIDKAKLEVDKAYIAVKTAEHGAIVVDVAARQKAARESGDAKLATRDRLEARQDKISQRAEVDSTYRTGAFQRDYAALQTQIDALGKTDKGASGSQNSLNGMVALLQSLGMTVAHTTDGKHVAGSEHYSGHAIDFVPSGGMGQYSKAEIEQMLTDAGVKFSYGTKGVKQFFGPGDKGHSDHFHVGFTGSPTPESADGARESAARRAAAAAEKAAQEEEAVSAAYANAAADRTQAMRKGNHSIEQQAQLDRDAVDAKLEEKLVQNTNLKRPHFVLDAYEGITADIRKEEITRREEANLAVRSLDQQRDLLQLRGALLSIEAQFARTAGARRRIGLAQLENERSIQLNGATAKYKAIVNPTADQTATYNQSISGINQIADANAGVVRKQTQGPTADFKDRLKDDTDNINEALDGVRARGLQSLEDGLVGIISGTESVGGAFKKMAASILADLARIAAEKLILSFIGFSGGDVPGHATGMIPGYAGGIISGPGTGTSDSILAMHAGKGLIRVSNGESIITAEGTRRHPKLLKAINDNSLPGFATGFVPSYPSIPTAGALQVRPVIIQQITLDARGSITTAEFMGQVNRQMSAIGQAAVLGGAGLAQQQANEAAMARLG